MPREILGITLPAVCLADISPDAEQDSTIKVTDFNILFLIRVYPQILQPGMRLTVQIHRQLGTAIPLRDRRRVEDVCRDTFAFCALLLVKYSIVPPKLSQSPIRQVRWEPTLYHPPNSGLDRRKSLERRYVLIF